MFPKKGEKWGSFFAQGEASPPPERLRGRRLGPRHPPVSASVLWADKHRFVCSNVTVQKSLIVTLVYIILFLLKYSCLSVRFSLEYKGCLKSHLRLAQLNFYTSIKMLAQLKQVYSELTTYVSATSHRQHMHRLSTRVPHKNLSLFCPIKKQYCLQKVAKQLLHTVKYRKHYMLIIELLLYTAAKKTVCKKWMYRLEDCPVSMLSAYPISSHISWPRVQFFPTARTQQGPDLDSSDQSQRLKRTD